MNKLYTTLAVLALTVMAVSGAVGTANAAGHIAMPHGVSSNNVSPKMQAIMQQQYEEIAPLQQELFAKRLELNNQIAAGADNKSVQDLVGEVNTLQTKLTAAQTKARQELVRSGIPYSNFMQYCMMMGAGQGHGMMGAGQGYGMMGNSCGGTGMNSGIMGGKRGMGHGMMYGSNY